MFARVLMVLDSRADGRDALVLGAQLTDEDGALLVAHVLQTAPVPLAASARDAATQRARLRDYRDEVYATLGPDPRVRYLPVSGLPLAEAAAVLARREQAQVIVIGQSLLSRGGDAHALVANAPCPVAVAPYGHRFARSSELARIALASDDDDVTAILRDAHTPILLAPPMRR
jgi:nucleotide-binding universal stress UspA family protein